MAGAVATCPGWGKAVTGTTRDLLRRPGLSGPRFRTAAGPVCRVRRGGGGPRRGPHAGDGSV